MELKVGAQAGPYTIVSVLGVGGMNAVYRARDTKLGRDVAIKVLPPEVALVPERLVRFRREAQVDTQASRNPLGALKKVPFRGGAPITIQENVFVGIATWGEDDSILFQSGSAATLDRVSSHGGNAEPLDLAPETGELWAPGVLLPDARVLLTTSASGKVAVISLTDDESTILVDAGAFRAEYAPSGHVDGSRVTLGYAPFLVENADIWLYEVARATLSRLTTDPASEFASLWSPDGKKVFFVSFKQRAPWESPNELLSISADGTGSVEHWLASLHDRWPYSWSRDGESLVFEENNPETGSDIGLLSMDGKGTVTPLIRDPSIRAIPPSHPTAASSPTSPTSPAGSRCTSGGFPEWETSIRSRIGAEPFPSGDATAGSFFTGTGTR